MVTGSPPVTPAQSPAPGRAATPAPAPTATPAPAPTVAPPHATSGSRAVSCTAVYTVVSSWPGGFQAQIVLTDTGGAALGPWGLTWTFRGGQQISSMWNATATQSGHRVTASHAPYNATIAAARSVTIGFIGTGPDPGPAPAAFAVNGRSCS